jgi:hypothetical protein
MSIPYEGGPVVFCPQVYTSFWGPSWTAENAGLAGQLNQFIQDLVAATPWMNTLTQYGVSGYGVFMQASYLTGVPSTLTVATYEEIFDIMIAFGTIPAPAHPTTNPNHTAPQVMMVFLDPNVGIDDPVTQRFLNVPGAQDGGYHDSFTLPSGSPFIYAFSGFFDLNSITTIMSHEFAEMITDPLYNAWTPDHAHTEIGDLCEFLPATTITVGGRTWSVQKIWSDDANSCVASSPSRTTPITPGPGGTSGEDGMGIDRRGRGPALSREAAVVGADVLPHQRVLPLPSVHFDLRSREKRIDEADVHAYVRNLFSPVCHEQVFNDFPSFLRETAAVLEQAAVAEAAPKVAGNGEAAEEARAEVLVGGASHRRPGVAAKARSGAKQTRNAT